MPIREEGSIPEKRRQGFWKDEFFDGSLWMFEQGTDFDIPPENFRHLAYVNATRRGCKVWTSVDDKQVRIQAHSFKEEK